MAFYLSLVSRGKFVFSSGTSDFYCFLVLCFLSFSCLCFGFLGFYPSLLS
jgi:hypothetical protein